MNEIMNKNNAIPRFETGHIIEGSFRAGRVDPDGGVTWQGWQKNMMLNVGMNVLGDVVNPFSYADLMLYANAGTGSRVNKFDSGGSEVSQSGTLLGLSGSGTITNWDTSADGGNYTKMLQSGDVIQFADGTEVMVASVESSVSATAFSSSQTIAAQTFVIYKTSQTSLHSSRVLTSTYVANQNGATTGSNTTTLWKTYDFAIEAAAKTYTEVGLSDYYQNQVNRCLLDTPLLIPLGSQLRLTFNMAISIYPSASVIYPNAMINGWPESAGTASVQQMKFEYFLSDGSIPDTRNYVSEPYIGGSTNHVGWISTNTGSVGELLLTGGTPIDRRTPAYALADSATTQTYKANTFYFDRTSSFSVARGSSSLFRSFGFGDAENGNIAANATRIGWAYLMNNSQSKSDLQTLSFTIRTSWGRVLE